VASVAGGPRGIPVGQVAPLGASAQHPEDAVEYLAIVTPRTTAAVGAALRLGDQRLEDLPLFIREVHRSSSGALHVAVGEQSTSTQPFVRPAHVKELPSYEGPRATTDSSHIVARISGKEVPKRILVERIADPRHVETGTALVPRKSPTNQAMRGSARQDTTQRVRQRPLGPTGAVAAFACSCSDACRVPEGRHCSLVR